MSSFKPTTKTQEELQTALQQANAPMTRISIVHASEIVGLRKR